MPEHKVTRETRTGEAMHMVRRPAVKAATTVLKNIVMKGMAV